MYFKAALISTMKRILPLPVKRLVRRLMGLGGGFDCVRWGSFRRLIPFSRSFGYDRGSTSVARYYVDRFLEENCADIHGDVLEIGDRTYTNRLGGARVSRCDVLHVLTGNPDATIVADLATADNIKSNQFDCIIMPQTLQFIYDVRAAMCNVKRILKPGGVALITLSGISQISRYDMDRWGEYWRFTTMSARRLFEEFFPGDNIQIQPHGNVLAAQALLQGLASEELKKAELDYLDPDYQVVITARVVKPCIPQSGQSS